MPEIRLPMEEYARPIYEKWDRDGDYPPPNGYDSWIAYLESGFKIVSKESESS